MTQNPARMVEIELRLAALERQNTRWRLGAIAAVALLLIGAATAFQRIVPVTPLEGTSLTLRDDRGRRVALALSESGSLEIRFGPDRGPEQPGTPSAELVLVDPKGQRVARLGPMTAQHLSH
jgi:hypothetical protein